MAWLSSSKSNIDLVKNLCNHDMIKSNEVKSAMLSVDRALFAPSCSYMDCPQPIGYGATISAPHMHAYALESLKDKLTPGSRVLDVGSGSGYLTACLAAMVGKTGKVIGVEHIDELVKLSIENLRNWNPVYLDNEYIKIFASDGRLGWPSEAPYDAIHVGAAASVIPQSLIDQLKNGGRMIIPVGQEYSHQHLVQVDKLQNGHVVKKNVCGVQYVPLTNKDHQLFHT